MELKDISTEDLVKMKQVALADIEDKGLMVQAINKELHPRNMQVLAKAKMDEFIKANTPKEDVEEVVITSDDVGELKV